MVRRAKHRQKIEEAKWLYKQWLKILGWWYEITGHFDFEQYLEDEIAVQERVTEYFDNKLNNAYGEPRVYNIEFACSDNKDGYANLPKNTEEFIHSIKKGDKDEA
jgi:hypothetical protein